MKQTKRKVRWNEDGKIYLSIVLFKRLSLHREFLIPFYNYLIPTYHVVFDAFDLFFLHPVLRPFLEIVITFRYSGSATREYSSR